MLLQETILCATSPTTTNTGPGLIAIHDIQTGGTLASFKQTNANVHSTAVFQSKNAQGGFILASQPDKSILNVYNFQKDQISLKIILPEKLSCIVLDRRGDLCAGGTATGRIYLWEVSSGILFNSWDAHYRQVNVLRFTNDGAALISGSDDSGVSVWSVSRLLDEEAQKDHVAPFFSMSDHTLPITDIICGIGIFPDCRVLTSSVDHSVKLWDLSSRSLLTTFYFPQPISYLAWDVTERLFFAASADGSIHQMNLFRERTSRLGGIITEAVGGAGVTDVIRVDDENGEVSKKRLISVGEPLSSICISLTSSILLAGTLGGLIHLYDIASHQLLRTISTHKGLSITHLETMIKPPDLIGHISLDFRVGTADTKDIIPVKPVAPFQRMQDAKARDAHEVTMMLPSHNTAHLYVDEASSYSTEELFRDHAYFLQPLTAAENGDLDSASLKSKVSELESEVESLREQLCKAKDINDAMWNTVVKRLVSQVKDPELPADGNGNNENMEDDQRRKKKGRAT